MDEDKAAVAVVKLSVTSVDADFEDEGQVIADVDDVDSRCE